MKEELKEIKDTIEQVFSITLNRASDDCIEDLHSTYTLEKENTSLVEKKQHERYDTILRIIEKEIVKRWLHEGASLKNKI